MRIAVEAREIVTNALDEAHRLGMKLSTRDTYNRNNATAVLLQRLDTSGFEIVRKPSDRPDIVSSEKRADGRVMIKTPEGSPVRSWVVLDEVDEAQPADATLRKGAVVELPKGFAVVGTGIGIDTQHAIEPRAQAIRDCVEASRLQHRAAAVLGYDAVSELMSELPAPEGEAA